MAATEIHGISDTDVRDAPTFDDIASEVAQALSGAVFAAYNVYFDAKYRRWLRWQRPFVGSGGRREIRCFSVRM
jgi:DNA polymerase III alpha subunit (gram-positive type)